MEERNLRKTRVGIVSSDKMDKTIVVSIKDSVKHPLYKKVIKRTVKFKAHDELSLIHILKEACFISEKTEKVVKDIDCLVAVKCKLKLAFFIFVINLLTAGV